MTIKYCECGCSKGIYIELEIFGYWDVCVECENRLEDGFHYYDEPI